MPKPRVYVETTIPNFYYDFRGPAEIAARRIATRQWWTRASERYDLVTSSYVQHELSAGTSGMTPLRLHLLDGIPALQIVPAVHDLVQVYIANKLMPAKPLGDAMHLALASYYDCDFIVTWNCRHLANPNKATHIRQINTRLGLCVPALVTPSDLMKGGFDV
ncbi:type II toxin-antitoxin system VapC family toxin [Longimicrobium sp.]|uniref:type II toxin-antitoxin system VapC family toxin n=1 Tax=Longimicrobium sp. TaxID=2029185 RepID=UPI002E2FF034|nr:type II toxin-antitoxin system VapC family toxin [Longimicrobium sp.]HEX6039449.1 type II toxin-antitoxin system VapC family toxin [Longimicrobium sp.]